MFYNDGALQYEGEAAGSEFPNLTILYYEHKTISWMRQTLTSMEKTLGTELSRMLADATIIESFMVKGLKGKK